MTGTRWRRTRAGRPRTASAAAGPRVETARHASEVRGDHFPAGDGPERREHEVHVDVRGDPPDRAVTHDEVNGAVMEAGPAAFTLVAAVGRRRSVAAQDEVRDQGPA